VVGLNEQFVHDLGGTLYLLFTAVALLLAIGCGGRERAGSRRGAWRPGFGPVHD